MLSKELEHHLEQYTRPDQITLRSSLDAMTMAVWLRFPGFPLSDMSDNKPIHTYIHIVIYIVSYILYYMILHYIKLYFIILYYILFYYITLNYFILHYIILNYIY